MLPSYHRMGQRMQDITGDGGVLKEILRAGSGEVVPRDASVLASGIRHANSDLHDEGFNENSFPLSQLTTLLLHHTGSCFVNLLYFPRNLLKDKIQQVKFSGYLEHTDRPFDTNCFRKNPKLMKLGEDITLQGMEAGLLTMKKGELARYLFKPSYAFGALGCPPLIPPNATVMFEIELLDFLDSAESDQFFNMSPEQQGRFPLQKVLKVAATEREFGNYLFRQKHFKEAKKRYKRAFSVLNHVHAKEDEQVKVNTAKLLIFLNLSFTYLKLECPARALAYGEKALEIDEKNAKALFRCGQACLSLAEYERSRDFLVKAQKVQPFNCDINDELKKLARNYFLSPATETRKVITICYRDYMTKEKEMCCRMFSSLSCPSAEEDLKPWITVSVDNESLATGALLYCWKLGLNHVPIYSGENGDSLQEENPAIQCKRSDFKS